MENGKNIDKTGTIGFPGIFGQNGSAQQTRSKRLLNKVYDHLDTIDVSKLSMSEMKDFLEVVQKGQFLETFGQVPQYGLGMFGSSFNSPNVGVGQGDSGVCAGDGESSPSK